MRQTLSPFLMPALLLLAACATPQERCIQSQTRDLRTVEALIAQTQRNLDRGYGEEEYTITVPVWEPCGVQTVSAKGKPQPVQMCLEDRSESRVRPVAIDLVAERAKLESLLAKRDQLQAEAAPRIAQCQSLHPE